MGFIENTMFEIKVSNSVNNQTQNVAGKFGTGTGSTFAAADCSAGLLCVTNGLLPVEGYESFTEQGGAYRFLNGNTYYFNAATNGNSGGRYGDHTGIYACNTYDVQKLGSGDQIYNLGAKTLGLGVPAGYRSDFTEIIIGEQYTFGKGNFSTAPTTGSKFATIANGLLVATASAPAAGSGVYFEIMRSYNETEGASDAGTVYVLKALRTLEAAAA